MAEILFEDIFEVKALEDPDGKKFDTGRETPSVPGIINPGAEGFQKLFFGQEEIAIPVHPSIEAACSARPTADVFINFASYRSYYCWCPRIRHEAADLPMHEPTTRLLLVLLLLEESMLELLRLAIL